MSSATGESTSEAQDQKAPESGSIERWFFDPKPVHALVAGRIVFGTVLFLCYAVRLPDAAP